MGGSRRGGLAALVLLAAGIFAYSQYVLASDIGVDVARSDLLGRTEAGSDYDLELRFENPSLLPLSAGETEFTVSSGGEEVGRGVLEPFVLRPLESSSASGTFRADPGAGGAEGQLKITGTTRYDMVLTSIEVPFVYYPTDEQASEFIRAG